MLLVFYAENGTIPYKYLCSERESNWVKRLEGYAIFNNGQWVESGTKKTFEVRDEKKV